MNKEYITTDVCELWVRMRPVCMKAMIRQLQANQVKVTYLATSVHVWLMQVPWIVLTPGGKVCIARCK